MKREIPKQSVGTFYQSPVTVTWKLSEKALKEELQAHDYQKYLQFYEEAATKPKEVLPYIEKLYHRHPTTPEVANLLAYAYIATRRGKKAQALIKKNYENNQDHLISRINYADMLLRKKKKKEIPPLFSGIEDLAAIFPQKKTFHASEYRAFHTFFGFYKLAKKDKEAASCHHYLAHKIDPHHPSVRLLGKKIAKKSLKEHLQDFRNRWA